MGYPMNFKYGREMSIMNLHSTHTVLSKKAPPSEVNTPILRQERHPALD
jgi:hypothetical protein